MRRKILMGVLALALPVGTMAALSSAASAKPPAGTPVTCTGVGGGGGLVTFGTPLTVAGVATSSKTGNATTISGSTFTCSGPGIGPLSGHTGLITLTGGKNAKLAKTDPRYNKTAGIKYVTGTWSEFTAAGGSLKKSLKQIVFTIGGQSVLFKSKSASLVLFGACGGDVGFNVSGQVKSGTYADKTASVLTCLGTDAGPGASGNFGGDYGHANGVNTANIDPSVSKAVV